MADRSVGDNFSLVAATAAHHPDSPTPVAITPKDDVPAIGSEDRQGIVARRRGQASYVAAVLIHNVNICITLHLTTESNATARRPTRKGIGAVDGDIAVIGVISIRDPESLLVIST